RERGPRPAIEPAIEPAREDGGGDRERERESEPARRGPHLTVVPMTRAGRKITGLPRSTEERSDCARADRDERGPAFEAARHSFAPRAPKEEREALRAEPRERGREHHRVIGMTVEATRDGEHEHEPAEEPSPVGHRAPALALREAHDRADRDERDPTPPD